MTQRFLNRKALTGPGGINRSIAIFRPNTSAKNAIPKSVFTSSAATQLIEANLA